MKRINLLTVNVSFVIALLLFACSCGNRENQTVNQTNNDETVGMEEKTVSESSENITSNRYVDAKGQSKYLYVDAEGRWHTLDYEDVEVKPLFNGNFSATLFLNLFVVGSECVFRIDRCNHFASCLNFQFFAGLAGNFSAAFSHLHIFIESLRLY